MFDEALVEAHEALLASPHELTAKVRFVAIYHLVLESTLGLTSFRYITRYLTREGLLPGFVDGYSRIHHDETRHIGYGVWFLREAARSHPEAGETIRSALRGLLPAVAESLSPPPQGAGPGWEVLGVSDGELREFALDGLARRLGVIGISLE